MNDCFIEPFNLNVSFWIILYCQLMCNIILDEESLNLELVNTVPLSL